MLCPRQERTGFVAHRAPNAEQRAVFVAAGDGGDFVEVGVRIRPEHGDEAFAVVCRAFDADDGKGGLDDFLNVEG